MIASNLDHHWFVQHIGTSKWRLHNNLSVWKLRRCIGIVKIYFPMLNMVIRNWRFFRNIVQSYKVISILLCESGCRIMPMHFTRRLARDAWFGWWNRNGGMEWERGKEEIYRKQEEDIEKMGEQHEKFGKWISEQVVGMITKMILKISKL